MTITGGTWSYSGNPSASSLDQVRFLVGDTDGADQLLSDEEILWLIGAEPTVYKAAAMACRSIVTSGTLVDKRVGDFELKASMRADQYTDLAKSLERRSALSATPYAGGLTRSEHVVSDTDATRPAFTVGMHDSIENSQTGTVST